LPVKSLNLGLLSDFKRVIHFNSEISNRAFELRLAEQN